VLVPYTEHYPPDTKAAAIWLSNRQRGRWAERRVLEGNPDAPIAIENRLDLDALAEILTQSQRDEIRRWLRENQAQAAGSQTIEGRAVEVIEDQRSTGRRRRSRGENAALPDNGAAPKNTED